MSSWEVRQALRPRSLHETMNRPAERSEDLSGFFKHLTGELRPDYWLVSIAPTAAMFPMAFNVIVSEVLGKGTDIIFNGVVSKIIAQTPSEETIIVTLEAQGRAGLARMLDSMNITPGAGINFDALGRIPLIMVGICPVAALIPFLSDWALRVVVQNPGWCLRDKV